MSSELLPCPFCGGEAKTVLADTYPHRGMLHSWFVACKDSECGCELGFYGMDENGTCGTYETEAEAIAAWNTRAATTIGQVAVEVVPTKRTCKGESDMSEWVCSECQCWIPTGITHENKKRVSAWNFCPHCGAKVVE